MSTRSTSVGELVEEGSLVINDGHRMESSELVDDGGLPFIRGGDVSKGRIHLDEIDFIDEELRESFGNKVSQADDIVITTKGSVGRFALVRSSYPTFVYSPQLSFWRVRDEDTVLPGYLWQWVRSPEFRKQLGMYKGQTTMADYISLEDQRKVEIDLPPLPVQRSIADILGALDDKIELNRRMNETLEAMAQTLYRHWFVDFGPFQDREFKDTEALGPIPEGWEVGEVSDIGKFRNGKRPPTNAEKGPVPVWGANGPTGRTEEAFFEEKVLITGRVGTLGNVFRIESPVWPSDNSITIRPREESHFEFLYLTLQRIPFEAISRGSTQPLLAQKDLKPRTFPKPPDGELEAFHAKVRLMYELIDANKSENKTLAETRDYVLPKLISGEIEVNAAEAAIHT